MPGLGPRSARRAALQLLKKKDVLMQPLAAALAEAAAKGGRMLQLRHALEPVRPLQRARSRRRTDCVVAEVGDVGAPNAPAFKGRYHVLGGVLSALDGVRPDDLRIAKLMERASSPNVREIILALAATVDGQTDRALIRWSAWSPRQNRQPAFARRPRRRRT
ncbi:MAG: toprim domain-containing protein [Nocardioides sp.]